MIVQSLPVILADCRLIVGGIEDSVLALTDRSILYFGIFCYPCDPSVLCPNAAVDIYSVVVFLRERVVFIIVVAMLVLYVVDLLQPLFSFLSRMPSHRALCRQIGVPTLGAVGNELLEATLLRWCFGHHWYRLALSLVEVD